MLTTDVENLGDDEVATEMLERFKNSNGIEFIHQDNLIALIAFINAELVDRINGTSEYCQLEKGFK